MENVMLLLLLLAPLLGVTACGASAAASDLGVPCNTAATSSTTSEVWPTDCLTETRDGELDDDDDDDDEDASLARRSCVLFANFPASATNTAAF